MYVRPVIGRRHGKVPNIPEMIKRTHVPNGQRFAKLLSRFEEEKADARSDRPKKRDTSVRDGNARADERSDRQRNVILTFVTEMTERTNAPTAKET